MGIAGLFAVALAPAMFYGLFVLAEHGFTRVGVAGAGADVGGGPDGRGGRLAHRPRERGAGRRVRDRGRGADRPRLATCSADATAGSPTGAVATGVSAAPRRERRDAEEEEVSGGDE